MRASRPCQIALLGPSLSSTPVALPDLPPSPTPGADVVFDPVGGAHFDEAMKAAAPWGAQYLVIGFAAGGIPKVGG